MENEHIVFPCIEVTQPIGTFYIGAIDAVDLVDISFADVRRPEGRDIERYIGTQRDLSEGRVAELKKYVTTVDASFPTSIIVAVKAADAEFDGKGMMLSIRRDKNVAKIIDGQHRIAGLEGYTGDRFQLNVTVFVEMELEDQAMVFATINLKQTRVTKSLAYDLYEYATSRSPQKTGHDIAKLLNFKAGSPFYRRIRILGKATGVGTEVITQATFVDRLVSLISPDPMLDRDRVKRKKSIEMVKQRGSERFVFRRLWAEDRDAEIAKTVWNYFKAVEERWPKAWSDFSKGQVLARTTGFAALMRLLPEMLNRATSKEAVPNSDVFLGFFKQAKLEDQDFTSATFVPGSTGEADLVRVLSEQMFGVG